MRARFFVLLPAVLSGLAAAPSSKADDTGSGGGDLTIDIDVISKRLDEAREQIQPSLGATRYNFSPEALQNIPQGENAPLNQVLLQAPGVAQDSFGQIHLRGEHANVQYRLNGVELPEGLSVFGQVITQRFARSLSLITGALPAQYGFQTAGVVDIQTKTGTTNPGGLVSMYGGSWDWLQPSVEFGGTSGPLDYYIVADGIHNDRGIENPTASYNAIHDTTNQFHGLAYLAGVIDPNTRISLILGGFDGSFQIPNNPGQATLGYNVNGVTSFNSAALNGNQTEFDGLRRAFAAKAFGRQGHADLAVQPHQHVAVLARLGGRPAVQRHRPAGVRGRTWPPASRPTEVGGSTRPTLCAPASWRRSSRPAPIPRRMFCRSTRPGCRPPPSR